MEFTISGRHVEITDAIRGYAQKRASKLPKYFNRVKTVGVVADKKDRTHEVEIIVQADGVKPFISRISGQDLYACIDKAVDKLERQLADHKARVRNHKGRRSMAG